MKLSLTLAFIVLGVSVCAAQKKNITPKTVAVVPLVVRKQILVDDLDSQAKNAPLAAARIFARAKLAEWLWKDGKDETGRAESLAVRAAEELYEKKIEIPNWVFLSTDLFALLEVNAKDAAKKLRAKYKIEETEELSNATSLLDKSGGDKIAAAKIKKALANGVADLNQISYLLSELRERKSPEFVPLLSYIVSLAETGANSFEADALLWLTDSFRDQNVSSDLRSRFYRVILGTTRLALQNSDESAVAAADQLLYANLADINQNAPEIASEANAIKSALSAKTSRETREAQERYKRIAESADKLEALIAEAEKADSKNVKQGLYDDAGSKAVEREKFQLAVDLYGKAAENITMGKTVKPEFRYIYHDQQLNEVVKAALAKDDVESAEYATKKIVGELSKAEALRQTAIYYHENKDSGSALGAYDEALKLVAKQESAKTKFYMLFRLIPAAQTIDRNRVSEVTSLTAKTIDNLPTPNPEDKPGSDNFNNYVSTIMAINHNVNNVMRDLIKKNKSEANDFAIRINRKDVKLIADVVLAINTFEAEKKPTN